MKFIISFCILGLIACGLVILTAEKVKNQAAACGICCAIGCAWTAADILLYAYLVPAAKTVASMGVLV